jgi:N-dimethylarginine dimethylaminohydrolase
MIRVCIEPNTFEITSMQDKQNPYIDVHSTVNRREVEKEHHALTRQFISPVYIYKAEATRLPDLVFVANGGLSLPRLPEPCVLLPYMKYSQRKRELPFLRMMFRELGVQTIDFPGSSLAPFEGQAELKWFHGGTLAVGGYGHRSTKKSFEILTTLLTRIYTHHGLTPPKILAIPLESDDYYHLDVAMLEYGNQCIVHKRAFSEHSLTLLRKFLGPKNVHVLDTKDSFCLNSIVDGNTLITHKITDAKAKRALASLTGLRIKEVDTTEFERSGGSVRCMTLDIHPTAS